MITKEKMLTITASAINKVRDLLIEEKLPSNSALRMFVQGGGCSGYQYGFAFDEEIAEDDFVTENEGVKVVVDMISSQYLQGATLDYKEEKFNLNVLSICAQVSRTF